MTELCPTGAADCARRLIGEFGSLGATLAATPSHHARVLGGRPEIVRYLHLIRRAMLQSLRLDSIGRPLARSMSDVIAYLNASMMHDRAEQVRVLFLDAKTRLIRDEQMGRGTLSEAPFYTREIMARALELGAAGIIVVHNHPSGDPKPSKSDIRVTNEIVQAARYLKVHVHDHIIVASSGHVSLRAMGHL